MYYVIEKSARPSFKMAMGNCVKYLDKYFRILLGNRPFQTKRGVLKILRAQRITAEMLIGINKIMSKSIKEVR